MRTYALGDIHGMSDLSERALAFIAADAKDTPARVVFLGDAIDRGPDSKGVLDRLMAGPTDPLHEWTVLMGNHEQMMLEAWTGDAAARGHWLSNGGAATLRSFGLSPDERGLAGKLDSYATFLAGLPLFAEDDERIYVHAGLRPGVPVARQNPHDLVWIREPFLSADHDFGRLVVHGHTPVPRVDFRPPVRLNIDTGAVFPGGALTVAVWEPDSAVPRFWQSSTR